MQQNGIFEISTWMIWYSTYKRIYKVFELLTIKGNAELQSLDNWLPSSFNILRNLTHSFSWTHTVNISSMEKS
jgi:hypothetical protein